MAFWHIHAPGGTHFSAISAIFLCFNLFCVNLKIEGAMAAIPRIIQKERGEHKCFSASVCFLATFWHDWPALAIFVFFYLSTGVFFLCPVHEKCVHSRHQVFLNFSTISAISLFFSHIFLTASDIISAEPNFETSFQIFKTIYQNSLDILSIFRGVVSARTALWPR